MSFISNFKFQISNLFSKTNLPTILLTLLLILTVGILFWYGENKIKEAGNINSTVIAWENLQNDLNNDSNLNLTIQNITNPPKADQPGAGKNTYTVSWLINKEKIDSQTVTLISQGKEIISPTKEVLAKLTEFSKNKQGVLYQVKINWNNKTEILGKWLK